MSRELSIFIDESGNFGRYTPNAPYYLISLVFHDQENDISKEVLRLENQLRDLGFSKDFYIHTSQIIRNEEVFRMLSLSTRQKLVSILFVFFNHIKVAHKTFILSKKYTNGTSDMVNKFTLQIQNFINDNFYILSNYDSIKIYYDKGQTRISKIIRDTFNERLNNIDNKTGVSPIDYKLLQVADMACTFELLKIKLKNGGVSKTEKRFFGGKRYLEKRYLGTFSEKEFRGKF